MSQRTVYWLALVLACADVIGCAYGYSLRPEPVLFGVAGFCASLGIVAGKYLWRTRKAGVRA